MTRVYKYYEGEEHNLDNILKEANETDLIHYITNNQEGLRIYKVTIDSSGVKCLKNVGDMWGLYDDPNHPEYVEDSD